MRLTCPNCSAQYEVPDEVIPEEGRDVQCSNCEKTWFQAKHPEDSAPQTAEAVVEDAKPEEAESQPEASPQPEPAPEPNAEPEPKAPAQTSSATGNIDPAVANILKEEAARESELRAQEGGGLETQPDLALDSPPEPDPEKAIKDLTATETAADAGQKEALPDVEAINSSLRSEQPSTQATAKQSEPPKSGVGFLRGFALIVFVGVVLFLIYGNAQQLGEIVPPADPILETYVSLVDQARLWLEAQTSGSSQN